ncbi:MAG: rane protein [Mycobacterium sp.]|nr:rane protein [Mycobacterium sp.]
MTAHAPTTRSAQHAVPEHQPPAAARAAAIVVALTALLAVLALAFALPAAKSKPHEVPIGIVGPTAVAEMLERTSPGAFAVTYYPGAAALRQAVLDRQVYGGIAFDAAQPTLFTATGGSPAIAQLLTQIGSGIAQHNGVQLKTEDLAPPSAADPRGAGLAASALPITLASILPAMALVLVLRQQVWLRFAATVAFAGLMGVTAAALLRYPLGSIDQNFWGVAGGLALGIAAALLFVLGLGSLFGRTGLAIGAGLAVLVGNPLSGLTSAPEMLPAGWGTLGQLLPQGATATLLRSTAYFGGAGATSAILVLSCWAIAGTTLIAIAAVRRA